MDWFFDWSFDGSIYVLICWLVDWLVDWLIWWFNSSSMSLLIDSRIVIFADWSIRLVETPFYSQFTKKPYPYANMNMFCYQPIALKNYKGDYVLNGHWTISNPGLYKLNGHYAVYKRNANENSIRINGPIDAPITVEVQLSNDAFLSWCLVPLWRREVPLCIGSAMQFNDVTSHRTSTLTRRR